MVVLQDGVLAFFSAEGATTVIWFLAGVILHANRPTIPGLLLVLPVQDDAPALEMDFRELRRLRNRLPGAKILVADCGLSDEGRSLARYLTEREKHAEYLDAQEYVNDEHERGMHGRVDLL